MNLPILSLKTLIGVGWMMVVGDWLQSAGPLGTSLAFLGSAGMILRLSLSGATTHRTVETHSLADNFSSTAQNIAFATNDIFTSAECMAANGFSPLAIPQNYYEDLAARFDLADELLNRGEAGTVDMAPPMLPSGLRPRSGFSDRRGPQGNSGSWKASSG